MKYNIHLLPFEADRELYLYRHRNGWKLIDWSVGSGRAMDEVSFTPKVFESLYVWVYGWQGGRSAISGCTNDDMWIPENHQHYHNQRSMGAHGDSMCSMTSMTMDLGSLRKIEPNHSAMSAVILSL